MFCSRCQDRGWYWVPNGPDDVDKEPCDCEAGERVFERAREFTKAIIEDQKRRKNERKASADHQAKKA